MNKAKRKGQPINLKRYWIRYSLLAIVLLIPFRIVGNWELTRSIYGIITLIIAITVMRFLFRFGWKHWIVALMIFSICLSMYQSLSIAKHYDCNDPFGSELIQTVNCRYRFGCHSLDIEFVTLGKTGLGTRIAPIILGMYPEPAFIYTCF